MRIRRENLKKLTLDLLSKYKFLIGAIIIALCLAVLFDFVLYNSGNIPKITPREFKPAKLQKAPEEIVDVSMLLKAFKTNPEEAKNKYGNRKLYVKGAVNYIDIDSEHGIEIYLVADEDLSKWAKSGLPLPSNDDCYNCSNYPYAESLVCGVSFNFWYDSDAQFKFDELRRTFRATKSPAEAVVSVTIRDWGDVYEPYRYYMQSPKRLGKGIKTLGCELERLIQKGTDGAESDEKIIVIR